MMKKIKQARGDQYWWIKKKEHEIDFRVLGLLHAFVKEAEHLRFEKLVKKIESHRVPTCSRTTSTTQSAKI